MKIYEVFCIQPVILPRKEKRPGTSFNWRFPTWKSAAYSQHRLWISSNKESGDGYSDILVEIDDEEIGIILEVKYAQDGNLDAASRKALEQIELLQYEEQLRNEGIDHILKYGIACYKKICRVMLAGENWI